MGKMKLAETGTNKNKEKSEKAHKAEEAKVHLSGLQGGQRVKMVGAEEPIATEVNAEGEVVKKSNKKIVVFKRVSKDFQTQEETNNETTWKPGNVLTHTDWQPEVSECGENKYHACSRPYFCDEFRHDKNDDRYIAVECLISDVFVWKDHPEYPHKISFRRCTVLYECDRFGEKVKQ